MGLRAEGHSESLKDNSSCSVMVRTPAPQASFTRPLPQPWLRPPMRPRPPVPWLSMSQPQARHSRPAPSPTPLRQP